MRGREIFSRYRRLVEELSNKNAANEAWSKELRDVMRQLRVDSTKLTGSGPAFLYDELSDQFEQEAYLTDNAYRRKVLLAATKLLQIQRPQAS